MGPEGASGQTSGKAGDSSRPPLTPSQGTATFFGPFATQAQNPDTSEEYDSW